MTWNGPYVSGTIGLDPWGNTYQYEYPPTHGNADTPDIWSYGPDGEEGTEDDINSWGSEAGAGEGEGAPGEMMREPGPENRRGPRKAAPSGPNRSSPRPSGRISQSSASRADSPALPTPQPPLARPSR